jgi:hypothetical protein
MMANPSFKKQFSSDRKRGRIVATVLQGCCIKQSKGDGSMTLLLQKGLKRGRRANRLGMLLFAVLLVVLLMSVVAGVSALRAA